MPSGYAAIWNLFTDWCTVTGHQALPAEPATLLTFLTDCSCARATQRRRIAAINHHHGAAGFPRPGEWSTVLAELSGGNPHQPDPEIMTAVVTVLRELPSHGWTQGMFGRRDRCLLVLSQLAGVPYKELATLTVGDITLIEGTATIRSAAGAWDLRPGDDALLCGPCAVTRWLRALDVEITAPSTRVLAKSIGKATAVTDQSPHLCRSTRPLSPDTLDAPLLTPIDQWGYLPFPVERLTAHSLSRRVRDLLAGDLGARRQLPIDLDDDIPAEAPAPVPEVRRAVYSREDAQRAWARRRADLDNLAGVEDLLKQVDARARELDRRTAAVLAGQADPTVNRPEE